MSSEELIQSGLCDDLAEVFDEFPLEWLDDYGRLPSLGGDPCRSGTQERRGRRSRSPDKAK